MKAREIKTFYRGKLPHIQPIGSTFFVTFRLNDSIPKAKLSRLKQKYQAKIAQITTNNIREHKRLVREKRNDYFNEFDTLLHSINTGPHYLKAPNIANIVAQELHRFDNEFYDLIAYCVMSNHVHILIDTSIQIPNDSDLITFEKLEFQPLQNIMKRIKGPTAVKANRILKRSGKFWQRESYDRYIRNNKELNNVINYILQNPVKAGIVQNWEEYKYTYYKYREQS